MAEQVLTKQKLINADEDLGDLEEVLNGPPGKLVKTRLGREVYTLASVPQINTMTREEVDSALSLKAPQAKTYTKDEVDTTLAAYVGGRKAYTTLALAQADQANLPANTAIEVTNDGANNGTYQWDGATLTKSAYDPLTQAKKYTDSKTEYLRITRGVNIFDKTKYTPNSYYDYASGVVTALEGFAAAGLFEIKPSTAYRVPDAHYQQFAFFDSNKNYISGMPNPTPSHVFTSPSNAAYIGLTVNESMLDTMMLSEASKYPFSYTPFTTHQESLSVSAEQIDDFAHVNILHDNVLIPNEYVNQLNGNTETIAGFHASDFCNVKGGTTYKTSADYLQQFAFYDSSGQFISGLPRPSINKTFVTPLNARFVRFTIDDDLINSLVVAEASLFDAISDGSELTAPNLIIKSSQVAQVEQPENIKNTEIWVSADVSDTTAAFTGKNAIQLALNSITDASPANRYTVRAKKGLYKIDKASEFIGYIGYPSMIEMKDYVDVVGQGEGNTIVWAELPYNDADIGLSVNGQEYPRNQYQTIYNFAKDAEARDITFVAKNLRYTLHQDDPRGANTVRYYRDVGMIFKGNKGSLNAFGTGTSSGEETYVIGGKAVADSGLPFAVHSNIKFDKPSVWSFESYNFTCINNRIAILLQSSGSLVEDKLKLVGCSFGGKAYTIMYGDSWLSSKTDLKYDSFNHAEWRISGHGNDPFWFENIVASGVVLRFTSNNTGVGGEIRFDKNSSAFPLLIKNNQTNADASLYTDNREYIDGYIAEDGSINLPSRAFGCLDLSGHVGHYDNGIEYTSVAKRLGDCTTNNKVLRLTVNGTENTILLDKNYTAMTNADFLADVNAQLTNAVADFYVYGRDYFPMISDVAEYVYNFNPDDGASQAPIPKGSVVTRYKGTIKLANEGDTIFGVALDDIPVMRTTSEGVMKGQGRVMKRGYMSLNQSHAHFALSDNQSATVGSRFKTVNGQLVSEPNGNLRVDIDNALVSINC